MGRKKVQAGDTFEFTTEERGLKGYGRVVRRRDDVNLVQIFKLQKEQEFDVEKVKEYEVILWIMVWNDAFTKAWKRLAYVPIEEEIEIPDFYGTGYVNGENDSILNSRYMVYRIEGRNILTEKDDWVATDISVEEYENEALDLFENNYCPYQNVEYYYENLILYGKKRRKV